jgi:transcriptional regulator with XRE-family HTH domain
MVSLSTPNERLADISAAFKARRKSLHLSQAMLAAKSGVPLPTLRRYEQTGKISLASFVKLLFVLDLSAELLAIFDEKQQQYPSMDALLQSMS